MKKVILYLVLLVAISIPTFARMVRPGIQTTQDAMHVFRLVEFDKCLQDGQIPCRWAPDAGFGYGEPVFNFYGQFTYGLGEIFHLVGASFIASTKLLFILSLLGSGIAMFFLAKHLWQNDLAALVSAVVYLYAPYRAVDVWVRGALPEALSFILFPLILLSLDIFIEKRGKLDLWWFSLLIFLQIICHSLSLLLFSPVLIVWTVFRLITLRRIKLVLPIIIGLFFSALMAAFYLLPFILESKDVNLQTTIEGYFDFRGHFASLYQLLISRFWGYGASLFQEEGMSRSVGLVQWILPLIALSVILVKKKVTKYKEFIILILIGWLGLFLAHNKSTFIWLILKPMAYFQFPWRFLGIALFAFSLASGCLIPLVSKYQKILAVLLITAVVVLNYSFFKEDIWQKIADKDLLSGKPWENQMAASRGDFWPKFGGPIPDYPAPEAPKEGELITKTSHKITYRVKLEKEAEISFPVAYFPGWSAQINGEVAEINPDKNGLIRTKLPAGESLSALSFGNTRVRTIGNLVSLISILGFGYLFVRFKRVSFKL